MTRGVTRFITLGRPCVEGSCACEDEDIVHWTTPACRACGDIAYWAKALAGKTGPRVATMQEPALSFEGSPSHRKKTVRIFYKDMWDHADKSLIPKIFHEGFTFRGSLGPTPVGHDQFAGYVDLVTGALGQYTTDILAMIQEGNRVSGKMRFHGYHRQELFGVVPSGRHVSWIGMPIFTFEGPKVRDLYVLGDIYGLIARLKEQRTESGGHGCKYFRQRVRNRRNSLSQSR